MVVLARATLAVAAALAGALLASAAPLGGDGAGTPHASSAAAPRHQQAHRPILEDPRFGPAVRERLFLREGLTQFNHGSFGTVPRDVMAELHRLQEQCEADPDVWIQSAEEGAGYRPMLAAAREAIAGYVGAEAANLVFVENASGGCNSFIRSVAAQLPPAPKILLLSCAYGMVKNILYMLEDEVGAELVEVEVSAVLHSPELFLATVEEAILANGGAATFSLAVISHIASIPGVILPVEDFIELLPGVPVMVDGAHAPGTVPLELEALRHHHRASHDRARPAERGGCAGCAGYIGNMHKWLFAPKGTAFLWVTPEWQAEMVPPTLSGCRGDFLCAFEYTGTRDYAPFATVPAGLEFRTSVATEEEVMSYGHELALWTGEYLSELWETEVLQPESMTAWMTNVRWPTDDSAVASAVSARLLAEYDTRLNVFTLNGLVYSRVSLQIYLTTEDVERVGGLVLELLEEAAQCRSGAGVGESAGAGACEWLAMEESGEETSRRPAVVALTQ
jgi:isopenicillin-N epimerase